jgi:inner membrane transporter RhtA
MELDGKPTRQPDVFHPDWFNTVALWFECSAVPHYLEPAFAILLFPHVGVLGMAWLRVATAALIFATLTRPWTTFASAEHRIRLLLAFGAGLAAMNCAFYLALARLPISLASAIEFVGAIAVALYGLRSLRNFAALAIAMAGALLLIDVKWSSDPAGFSRAFLNGALFDCCIVLGHRISRPGTNGGGVGLTRSAPTSSSGI